MQSRNKDTITCLVFISVIEICLSNVKVCIQTVFGRYLGLALIILSSSEFLMLVYVKTSIQEHFLQNSMPLHPQLAILIIIW